jgi:hypothetical protein
LGTDRRIALLAAHVTRLADYPPRQSADSLSTKKVIEAAMKKPDNPHDRSN